MRLIDEYRLAEAFEVVGEMSSFTADSRVRDSLQPLRDTYRYMIHYMVEGVADAGRDRMLGEVAEKLRVVADRILRGNRLPASPDIYSSTLRLMNLRPQSLSELIERYGAISAEESLALLAGDDNPDLQRRKEETLETVFNLVFTSFHDKELCREASEAATASVDSDLGASEPDTALAAEITSALTLGLLVYYDKYKLSALLDIYELADSSQIAARALTGIILALAAHPRRVADSESVVSRMSLWKDYPEAYSQVKTTIRAIMGTRDTDRVTAKMKDEVLPELMKLRPEIMKKMGELPKDIDPGMMEDNPEWQEMLDKSGLTGKLQELSEMQSDGADLMMVTFSNLKQFPFFNRVCNWFLPFSMRNTALALPESLMKVMEGMLPFSRMICDSDKYSLALALKQMPEAQSRMVSSQFDAQMRQFSEEMKDREGLESEMEFGMSALKAVRDLYRFFKLFRNREGIANPFDRPVDFIELPVIGEMLANDEMLLLAGEFYFKRGYYREALPMFRALAERDADNPQVWEKIGFSLQQLKDLPAALEAYEKSELLKAPGPWLMKKLAVLHRRMGNMEKALGYYNRLLEADPDNRKLLMNAGHILYETGDLQGALSHYYHANYLQPDDARTLRAIAYVELLNGNAAKSSDYYARILEKEPTAEDYLNAGHARMAEGKFREAEEMYLKSAEGRFQEFALAYEADIPTLAGIGLDARTLRLMLDNIRLKK